MVSLAPGPQVPRAVAPLTRRPATARDCAPLKSTYNRRRRVRCICFRVTAGPGQAGRRARAEAPGKTDRSAGGQGRGREALHRPKGSGSRGWGWAGAAGPRVSLDVKPSQLTYFCLRLLRIHSSTSGTSSGRKYEKGRKRAEKKGEHTLSKRPSPSVSEDHSHPGFLPLTHARQWPPVNKLEAETVITPQPRAVSKGPRSNHLHLPSEVSNPRLLIGRLYTRFKRQSLLN